MRPINVLQYRGSAEEGDIPPHRWWHPLRFPLSLVLATIALMAGIFASWILYLQCRSMNPNAIGLTLFVAGVPLLFLLLITSAITSKLATAEHMLPWTRAEKLAVFLPQFAAIVLPVAVMVVCGHP